MYTQFQLYKTKETEWILSEISKMLESGIPDEMQFAKDAFIKGSKRGYVAGSNAMIGTLLDKPTAMDDFNDFYKKYKQ